jgi:hypothetical protein
LLTGLTSYEKDAEQKLLNTQKKKASIAELATSTAELVKAVNEREKLKNWVSELIKGKISVHEDPMPETIKKQIQLPSTIAACWPDRSDGAGPKVKTTADAAQNSSAGANSTQ